MADVTSGGKTLDSRQAKIRLRRKGLEIYSMKGQMERFECDILDKEADIERLRDQIVSMSDSISDKEAELAEQEEALKEQ